MENFLQFAVNVILLSAAVIIPFGPITLVGIIYGVNDGWKSGIKFASGSALVKIIIIVILGFGLSSIFDSHPDLLNIISLAGGVVILYFAYTQIKRLFVKKQHILANMHNEFCYYFCSEDGSS